MLSFGQFYFDMALLFRQSMLLCSILCNSEVLYGVNKGHVETLESVDTYFWRRIFKCPMTTPTEAFYLETNSLPIRYLLVSRQLMYYWDILHMQKNELVNRVFSAQMISSGKNDWVLQISEDLKICDIRLTEEEIINMKKSKFRRLVRCKIREASQRHLVKLRKSKSINIWPSKNMKKYLKTNLLNTEEKQLLFMMRCRMNQVKSNFKNQFKNNLNCLLCESGIPETESHLLQCPGILGDIGNNILKIQHSDIYGVLDQQIKAIQVFKKVFRIRKWKIENRTLVFGPQVHHQSASDPCDDFLPVDSHCQDQ